MSYVSKRRTVHRNGGDASCLTRLVRSFTRFSIILGSLYATIQDCVTRRLPGRRAPLVCASWVRRYTDSKNIRSAGSTPSGWPSSAGVTLNCVSRYFERQCLSLLLIESFVHRFGEPSLGRVAAERVSVRGGIQLLLLLLTHHLSGQRRFRTASLGAQSSRTPRFRSRCVQPLRFRAGVEQAAPQRVPSRDVSHSLDTSPARHKSSAEPSSQERMVPRRTGDDSTPFCPLVACDRVIVSVVNGSE